MRSIDEIYSEMRAEYVRRTGLAISDGGDMSVRLYALASQLFTLEVQLDWLKRQSFPQTASNDFLDYHARLRGIERLSGTHATGSIRFALDQTRAQTVTVPEGTVCIAVNDVEFVTDSSGTIPPGTLFCEVTASARIAGSSGNVPSGSIIYMTHAPAGVTSCFNPAAFTGGENSESDELLRARVVDSYRRLPNGTNTAFYENQTLETPGVGAVSVIPRARGRGTVDIYVSSESGLPSQELLNSIETKLALVREICVDLSVRAPELVYLDIDIQVQPESGYANSAAINDIKTAVEALFNGKLLGKNILRTYLTSIIYPLPSVRNFTIISPAEDIIIDGTKLPALRSITVNAIGG